MTNKRLRSFRVGATRAWMLLKSGTVWGHTMPANTVGIRSRDGGQFDCYLVTPETSQVVPAVVLASTVHGVDADIRAIADEFATHGVIGAAPDLFWRSTAARHSREAAQRSPSRLEQIKVGEADMADTLAHLGTLAAFNGRAVAMGFCYGGPYAILGPKRLGYAAGISCHGSQMLDYIPELECIGEPVCLMWGDQDHRAPAEVLDAYRNEASHMNNVEVHIFAGVLHGYMMPGNSKAFAPVAREFSMARALAILDSFKSARAA